MKNKRFLTILMAGLLSMSCFAFSACDEEDSSKNNSNDDDEWTNNH